MGGGEIIPNEGPIPPASINMHLVCKLTKLFCAGISEKSARSCQSAVATLCGEVCADLIHQRDSSGDPFKGRFLQIKKATLDDPGATPDLNLSLVAANIEKFLSNNPAIPFNKDDWGYISWHPLRNDKYEVEISLETKGTKEGTFRYEFSVKHVKPSSGQSVRGDSETFDIGDVSVTMSISDTTTRGDRSSTSYYSEENSWGGTQFNNSITGGTNVKQYIGNKQVFYNH